MASIEGRQLILETCPHCGIDSPNISEMQVQNFNGGGVVKTWKTFACARCANPIMVNVHLQSAVAILSYFPKSEQVDDSIPDKAKHFLNEAIRIKNSPSSCIMACASSVDAMLKNMGYKNGKLYSRIKEAEEAHLITPQMATWAHEVRLDANDERHADEEAVLPELADAEKSLAFTKALAEYLFVLPSKIERSRGATR